MSNKIFCLSINFQFKVVFYNKSHEYCDNNEIIA